MNTWMAKENTHCVFISAKHKNNIDNLKKLIYNTAKKIHAVKYPYNNFLY